MATENELLMSSEQEGGEVVNPLACIHHHAGTDIGMRREENQDSFGIVEAAHFRFCVVADGMGGVQGGATASSMAVAIVDEFLKSKSELTVEDIKQAVTLANKSIFERGKNDPSLSGMGTTFVALGFQGQKLFVVNVGDSRAYRFRADGVDRLTEDHTLVMELVRSGTITIEQAGNHPVSHMLTRSLGPTPEIEVDCYISSDGPLKNDKYLLCSDGLYNLVTENEMLDVMNNNEPEEAIRVLIGMANQRGGTDNITILTVSVDSEYPEDAQIRVECGNGRNRASVIKLADDMSCEALADNLDGLAGDANFDPFAIPELDESRKKQYSPPQEKLGESKSKAEDLVEESSSSAIPVEAVSEEKSATESQAAEQESSNTATTEALNQTAFQSKATQYPKEEEQSVKPEKFTTGALFLGILVSGIIGAIFAIFFARFVLKSSNANSARDQIASAEYASTENVNYASEGRPAINPQIPQVAVDSAPSIAAPEEKLVANSNLEPVKAISSLAKENLQQRQEHLIAQINELNKKINLFAAPLSGETAEILRAEEVNEGKLLERQKQVRNEIDNATRKLAIWYGRKTKLRDADMTNLASEVAVSSEEVLKKKEAFELASWNYLKEAEAARYMPSDKDQKDKVEQLVKERNQKMNEMADAVHTAIDQIIRESEKQITELTLEREKIQEDLEQTASSISFSRVLMGNDQAAKDTTVKQINKSLSNLEAELREVEALISTVPDKQQSTEDSIIFDSNESGEDKSQPE